MLDFSFSEEQLLTQKTIREFAEKELSPFYQHHDKTETFPIEQWKKMGKLGLMGSRIPKEYEGNPVDYVTLGIIIKELARGDPNCAYVGALTIVNEILVDYANEKLKKEWLPPVARGEKIIVLGVTEPQCGSDVSGMKMKVEIEDDFYILNGEKSGISFMMDSAAMVTFAMTDPEAKARGVSSFFVPVDNPGVTLQSYKDMGVKAMRRGSAFLDNVKIPKSNLLGQEDKGFKQAMNTFDVLRVCLCMIALGAAEKSLDETVEYVKTREAFGRPIAKFEGVSFPIAEHYTKLMSANWLCLYALWAHDKGIKHTKETAMCKYYAPLVAVQAIHDCLLLHGHYGYTQEFPIEQRLRDVIALEFADGTSQIQKIIISREIIGKEYLPY